MHRLSTLGCLLVDMRHDFSENCMVEASAADRQALEAQFARIEKEAVDRLVHEGVAPGNIVLQRTIDMMYRGQLRSLAVTVPSPVADLVADFHREHRREYDFRRELRTCYSSVIYNHDFSSGLADGECAAQGAQDIPIHVGTLHLACSARGSCSPALPLRSSPERRRQRDDRHLRRRDRLRLDDARGCRRSWPRRAVWNPKTS